MLWKALGEGFWCPQVGGSKNRCDTWNRERVPLTGPSGLGVPRPLGAGGLVHPREVWEVLLRELGYGLLPAPPLSLGGHHALCPHPFHRCLDLRSPEEALETSPAPSGVSQSLVAGWNPAWQINKLPGGSDGQSGREVLPRPAEATWPFPSPGAGRPGLREWGNS